MAITTTTHANGHAHLNGNGVAGKLKLNGAEPSGRAASAQDNSKNRQAVTEVNGQKFVDPYNYVVSPFSQGGKKVLTRPGRGARCRTWRRLPTQRPAP